jgi:hypothetical protein
VRDTEGGILGSSNGRFFGWVIGGTLRRRWPRIGSPPPRTRTPPPT